MKRPKLAAGVTALVLAGSGLAVHAGDVTASAPSAVSVTVYRSPYRSAGGIDLQRLGGFALVTETRIVHLPSGESRLAFKGVVDGIQPESAIITGLPNGVVEKNRDAAVLSPETLMRASLESDLTLVRTNPKTGEIRRVAATIRSATAEGVVFQTSEGLEAYRCSGLPEAFLFDRTPNGVGSTPTLSALARADRPVTATTTLSYLAAGFDWAANYVATIGADGKTLDLSGWITLANANGVELPAAATQIVAGRLNHQTARRDPTDGAPRVVAACWPQGSTSDGAPRTRIAQVSPDGVPVAVMVTGMRRVAVPAPPAIAAHYAPPPPEQLGDLKLYRVPQATTVSAHQMKQVRLVDQAGVPFTKTYGADLFALAADQNISASIILRTKNSLKDKLGLPLPSGSVAVFDRRGVNDLLVGEAPIRDTAVDEDIELKVGTAPEIHVRQTRLRDTADAPEVLALNKDLALAFRRGDALEEVEITNARSVRTPFELRLQTAGRRILANDGPMEMKDGRPIFRLTLPANGAAKIRYLVVR